MSILLNTPVTHKTKTTIRRSKDKEDLLRQV